MTYETAITLGSMAGAFIFAYLSANIRNPKHIALQALLMFFSLILVIVSSGIMKEVALLEAGSGVSSLLTTYTIVAVFGFYVAIAYYILLLVWEVVKWSGVLERFEK